MSVADVSQQAVANLGSKEIVPLAPVFPGDTISAESEVFDKRESKSRPTQGIVTVRTTGRTSHGTIVMTFVRSALTPSRGTASMMPRIIRLRRMKQSVLIASARFRQMPKGK